MPGELCCSGEDEAEGSELPDPPEPFGGPVWSWDWAPGCRSLGFHHELFQRFLLLIPTEQKNFFNFILLETHIVKLS